MGCSDSAPPDDRGALLCQAEATAISVVQGENWYSPLQDSTVTIRGIVTFSDPGKGFYIEESGVVQPARSSKALYVSDASLAGLVIPGQQWTLSGRVEETGAKKDKRTSLTDVTSHALCAENLDLPLTRAELPMNSKNREALEGMRLAFEQALSITDIYNLHRGETTLSVNGALRVPTEIRMPGGYAVQQAMENRLRSIDALLPGTTFEPAPVGSTLRQVIGVLGHDGNQQQLLLESWQINESPQAAVLAPPAPGDLRIVSTNLLNFFNGDGRGAGFPTERGAKTLLDFEKQKDRTRAATATMRADLLAVQELENDGFGEFSAAQSLVELLSHAGLGDYAFVTPSEDRIGNDIITVGLFYRPQALEPIGPAHVLYAPEFDGLSRPPLAQLFRHRDSGAKLLVAVNHLKSKGRCPESGENTDQEDGQGCWNRARAAAVQALVPWLKSLSLDAGSDHVLILGDMNAWRNEEPIEQFKAAGYVDLVEERSGLPQHSFLYWGQTGTLDYAFASPALAGKARQAVIWHINADWPGDMDLPEPWLRMSDHDPVIVDFSFSHSATSD